MGRRPVTPRSPGRSLGAIGRTTLADSTVGGGHDDLIRRTLQQGGQEWTGRKAGRVRAFAPDPVDVTGDGAFGFNEFLVDEKWDVDQPCRATVTVTFTGGYSDQPVDPPTTPATYIPAPELLVQLIDGDDDRETVVGENYEVAYGGLVINRSSKTVTVTWDYTRGRPKLQAYLGVSAAQAAGISGSAPKLVAIARVTRL